MKFRFNMEEFSNLDRNEIILRATPFIKYIAKKIRGANYYLNLELDELVSYGVLGLIESLDRYDSTKANQFKTFAEFRIRGAMLDYIRSLDKTPRSARDKEKIIEKAKQKIESEEGKKASDIDIAKELGIKLNKYYELLNKSNKQRFVNLEDYLEASYSGQKKNSNAFCTDTPEDSLSEEYQKNLLKNAISVLSDREQQIIDLYYQKELNLKEISYILQISESRISQINKNIIKKLRANISENTALEEVI